MRTTPLLIVGILLYQGILAQTSNPVQSFEYNKIPGKQINHWVVKPVSASTDTGNNIVRYIVRLKSDPSRKSSRGRNNDNLVQEHQQFLSDFNRLSSAKSSGRSAGNKTASVVHHEYRRTFNGFAITTNPGIAEEIKKLPYVTSLLEDKKVEAFDTQSNAVIRATEASADFGATGKNVRIGIIDTGIDYNHPDLGNGFGLAYKVIGGYDFVNVDDDPMDDHGHGTHVAGIAAANGTTLKGVAPDSRLVAYKVLDENGSGYDSWILAAIERCTDPDQNLNTDDALDVVNMSLGRYADPSEPLSEAVNNAIAIGVVFVIAAGNSFDYFTIGTPGVARDAITVGATDINKQTAYFSSKGPTENTFLIKPEVTAPGVDINSTFLNEQYKLLSGTSMASPHVAGAVALLLEKKPDLTPQMVKSCLIGSARTNAPHIWDQGAGVIDIYESIKSEFVASPGILNFGIPEPSEPWTKTLTLIVTNTATTTQSITVNPEGAITQAPFNLTTTPSFLTLNPNENRAIQITLTVNTLTLPLQNLPETYTGLINLTNGSFTSKTPIALINPQTTRINFTGELPNNLIVVGIEGSNYWKPFSANASGLDLFLPKAKYDLITFYNGEHMVIKEGVNTEQNIELTLNKSLAKNLVRFKPLDKEGNEIPLGPYGSTFFWGENRNIYTLFPFPIDSLYVSDQEHYQYEFKYHGKSSNTSNEYYEVTASTGTGVIENKMCSNDPAKFSSITLDNPSIAEGLLQDVTYYIKSGGPWSWFTSWNNEPIEMPGRFKLFQSQHNLNTQGYLGSFLKFSPPKDQSGYVWETSDIRAEEGNKISFYQHINRKILTLNQQDLDFKFGKTIPNFILDPKNEETLLNYSTFLGRGAFNHAFGERERGNIYFKLYTQNAVIKEGNFLQSINNQSESRMPTLEVTPGAYYLDFEYGDFQTGGKFGHAKVSTHFNTAQPDKNPPWLKQLRLIANGRDTNELEEGETGVIQFSLSDICTDYCNDSPSGLKTSSLRIKPQHSTDWTTVAVNHVNDGNFTADLPVGLTPGYYSLSLTAEDNSDNTFAYEVSPAFLIGAQQQPEPFVAINLIEPKNYSINAGTNPLFRWSAIGGLTYQIQISQQSNFTGIVIEGTPTESQYILSASLEVDKTYYWRVRAVQNNNPLRWSSVFQFQSASLPVADLLSPADHALVNFGPIDFAWSRPGNASYSILEVSLTEDFSQLFWIGWTGSENATVHNLLPNTKYFWRVKSGFFAGWDQYETISASRTFTTTPLHPSLISPVNKSVGQPLSIQFVWSAVENSQTYHFELSKVEDFSKLFYQSPVQNISLVVSNLEAESEYFWRVTAFYFGVPQQPSIPNSFKTVSLAPAVLIFPANNEIEQPTDIQFKWSAVKQSGEYTLQISPTINFNLAEINQLSQDTTVIITNLNQGTKYYWRVLSKITAGSESYSVISETFQFNTEITTATEYSGDIFLSYPNPFSALTSFVIKCETYSTATLTIIDPLGRVVKNFSLNLLPGENIVNWNGRTNSETRTASGLLFAVLSHQNKSPLIIRLMKID